MYSQKRLIFKLLFLILSALPVFLMAGCKTADTKLSRTGFFFDTVITITLYDSNDESIIENCFSLCEEYENLLSCTISASDISRINKNSTKNILSTTVDSRTSDLISQAISTGKLTDGAFDFTILPLTSLWGFTGDKEILPSDESITTALSYIDYKKVSIKGNTVTVGSGQALDLGGIAKGFIADKLKEYLLNENVNSAIINLGGNVLEVGSKSNADFTIGLQYPFASNDKTIATVKSSDISIVTSGCYERYFKKDGVLYHHILDPNTGYPARNNLLGVTIFSKQSTIGDALSTSCYVLGYEKAASLIESTDGVEAVFIFDDYTLKGTSGVEINENSIISVSL